MGPAVQRGALSGAGPVPGPGQGAAAGSPEGHPRDASEAAGPGTPAGAPAGTVAGAEGGTERPSHPGEGQGRRTARRTAAIPADAGTSDAAGPSHMAATFVSSLRHRFLRPELLREALTHRSAAHGPRSGQMRRDQRGRGSNERLEFVGDRVLGLLVAEWLAERFPDEQEGQLGPRHAHLVSRPVLAGIAETMGLTRALSVAPNEARAGVKQLATVLADAMEAVIGAIYLDAGLEAARVFVREAWADTMAAQLLPPKDSKTALQEWLLARGQPLPHYHVHSTEGPSHAPRFVITVTAGGHTGTGTAGSKRVAERDAAADLLARLG